MRAPVASLVVRNVVAVAQEFHQHDPRDETSDMRPERDPAALAAKSSEPPQELNGRPVTNSITHAGSATVVNMKPRGTSVRIRARG